MASPPPITFLLKDSTGPGRGRAGEKELKLQACDCPLELTTPALSRHLVLQLGDLPLAGGVVLQVVQHDLGICQQGLGALQVLPEPLLGLQVPLAHLGTWQELGLWPPPQSLFLSSPCPLFTPPLF